MSKISIILPIFNNERTLTNTIDSICKQTLNDIEIICIDYGSTDNSKNLLKDYKNKYDFIKVFHLNSKLFDAKNFGIDQANGKYISFINANDIFIDEHALENLYNFAIKNNSDMISGNIKFNNTNKLLNVHNINFYEEYGEISPEEYGNIFYSFTKNIYKKDFLKDNNIYFNDLSWNHDEVFLAKILSKINTIYITPVNFYESNNIENISDFNNPKECEDYINHFKLVFDYLSDSKFDKIKYDYRYVLLDSIDDLNNDKKKHILFSVRKVFADNPQIVKNFEENFYFKNKHNKELTNLVNFERDINHPRISVLIPVYNAKDFLNDSISSLLNQTFSDIELICVNDGSKDNSLEILEIFANDDSRVKVIDKENGGCGSARNRALDEANGQYVYLFDPDDELSLETFEEAYKNAIYNDSEIVIFKSDIIIDDKIIRDRVFFDVKTKIPKEDYDKFTFNYLNNKEIVLSWDFAPWGKLYKKEFLDAYDDFRFDMGVAFDDVPFHVKSMLRAKRISFVDKFFYHYRMDNLNSVNNTSSNGYDIFKIMDILENILQSEGLFEEFKMEFNKFIVAHSLFYIISTNSEKYFKMAKERFENIKDEYAPPFPKYKLVMENEDYNEFKVKWLELELIEKQKKLEDAIKKLENDNIKLKNEISKLKKINHDLLNSTSWKITKPLRFIRNKRK